MLQPTTPRRERILSYGGEGAGKTTQWCQVAAWYRRTSNPAKFYVLDSDGTVDAMADGWDDFYDNVVPFDVADWSDYKDSLAKAESARDPDRGDWLVVDRADLAWSSVQDFYVESVLEQDVEQWMIQHAKGEAKGQHPLSGEWGMNWFYINKLYQNWFVPIMRWKGHVFLTAAEQALAKPDKKGEIREDPEVTTLYQRLGYRPQGQKNLGHGPHTVLRSINASDPRNKQWKISTIKDRQREVLSGKVIEDFVMDYLIPVGHWQM